MANYSAIINSFKEKRSLFNYKNETLEGYLKDKENLIAKKDEVSQRIEDYENLMFTCKMIIEKITFNSKHKLEKFLSYAFQSIFTDRHYVVELNLKEDTKKAGLEITLVEGEKRQEITESVGGGIISTLGLLLQIYYIEVYNLNKIMFIDEGLKEVSTGQMVQGKEGTNYLANILNFLKWLSQEKQYKFVIVTHDSQVKDFADSIYEVSKGSVKNVSS